MGYFVFVFTTLYLGLSIYLFYHLRRMKISKGLFWSLVVFFMSSFLLGAAASWIEIPLSKVTESWFRAFVFACFVALLMSTPIFFLRDLVSAVKKDISDSLLRKRLRRKPFGRAEISCLLQPLQ